MTHGHSVQPPNTPTPVILSDSAFEALESKDPPKPERCELGRRSEELRRGAPLLRYDTGKEIETMTDLTGRTLGHYRIIEQIGAGGMGVVYRAHDERLDRDVAIKVLPEEVAGDPDRLRRFEREAKALAALNRPNIATVYGFEVAEKDTDADTGGAFIAMELLEGESLREVIGGGGLTAGKAVEYAKAVAEGLAAAHEKGIIHRDLKPENVFLTKDGRIKILDFGLAKLKLSETDLTTETPTETLETAAGGLMGTVPYMAPEQVRGKPADHRSDIFALGVTLYEMLAGRRPFGGATGPETAAAILKEDPESIPGLSPALDSVISKCLEKRPEDRYSAAHDLALTLGAVDSATPEESFVARRWPHLLAVGVAALIALLFVLPPKGLFERAVERSTVPEVPRIVVLPFENLGSPEDEYFADSMTDEVRGKLFRLAGLEVIARYSSDQYRGTEKSLEQISEELGARYLLTAKVRWQKAGGGSIRVRVSPELVGVQPGATPVAMWHDTFDATFVDVFQVQGNIASRVAQALNVTLTANDERALVRRPTENLAAYDAFLQAEKLGREGDVGGLQLGLRQAELYRRAVALDPDFALAWTRLSGAESSIYLHGGISLERAESAREAAERGLEIDPGLPEARLAMASYFLYVENDRERSDEQIELGLEMAPNHPVLRRARAARTWRSEDRLAYLEEAAALDPLSWGSAIRVGIHQLFSRRYSEAQEWLDRAYSLAPTNLECIRFKTMHFLAQGDLEGARSFIRAAAEHVEPTKIVVNLASFHELFWVLDDEWQKLLFRLGPEAFGEDDYAQSLTFAHTHHLRSEQKQMLVAAETARAKLTLLLAELPDDDELNSFLGVVLAYLGRGGEAVTRGRRGLELSRDSRTGRPSPYLQLQLVRTHLILGELEPAIDYLEPLLDEPYYLSPGWLSIDPLFDPLRDHPRFQALLEKYESEE